MNHTTNTNTMKNQLKQIAEPNSVHSVARKLRNHSTAFHRAVRMKSLKFTEFQKFCDLCDSEIFVRKSDGSEIKL